VRKIKLLNDKITYRKTHNLCPKERKVINQIISIKVSSNMIFIYLLLFIFAVAANAIVIENNTETIKSDHLVAKFGFPMSPPIILNSLPNEQQLFKNDSNSNSNSTNKMDSRQTPVRFG
jgi:hypothetical protein